MTPEEVEEEYWRYQFLTNAGKGEEFDDDDLDTDEIIAALESGDDWEDLISERT